MPHPAGKRIGYRVMPLCHIEKPGGTRTSIEEFVSTANRHINVIVFERGIYHSGTVR